jgi:hypothetical protein
MPTVINQHVPTKRKEKEVKHIKNKLTKKQKYVMRDERGY